MSSGTTAPREEILQRIQEDESYKPLRSSHVVLSGGDVASGIPYVLKSKITGEYYSVDFYSVTIWWLLDGEHTVNQIVSEASGKFGDAPYETVRDSILFLADEGLLAGTEPEVASQRLRFVSAFELNYTISEENPDFFMRLRGFVKPFVGHLGLWATLILVLLGALLLAPNFLSILFNKANFQIMGSSIVGFFYYYLILFPVLIVHEIAHAATLTYYGGLWDVMPGEVGTGLFYFGPMFYVDTSAAWILPKKMRIMVSLAGPLSTLSIGSVLVYANLLWPSQLLRMASFFCFYWMLWNLVPLIETDGYYALMDFVGIPNLRKEAFDYLKTIPLRKQANGSDQFTRRQRLFLVGFALFSVVFVVFISYETYVIFMYMASDAFVAFWRILQGARDTVLVGDLASVAYFALMTVGFVTLPISLLRRRRRETSES